MDYKQFLDDFKRLSTKLNHFDEATTDNIVGQPDSSAQAPAQQAASTSGGLADLTPMKNKTEEASVALEDAQKAADSGAVDEAKQALLRAKAAIEQALGGIPAGISQ